MSNPLPPLPSSITVRQTGQVINFILPWPSRGLQIFQIDCSTSDPLTRSWIELGKEVIPCSIKLSQLRLFLLHAQSLTNSKFLNP